MTTRDRKTPLATIALAVVIALQSLCAAFFTLDIGFDLYFFDLLAFDERVYLGIKFVALLCLWLGVFLGARQVMALRRHAHQMQDRLRSASGAFHDLMTDRFAEWGFTPSEADVALLIMKGMSTAEIAAIRGAAEGTVKAQSSAVYRKAGVTSRSQFISSFIEDLMEEDPLGLNRDAEMPKEATPTALARGKI
ncbi:MAG: helix-turn-helix transcriptional regulator [Rubricella sp.]